LLIGGNDVRRGRAVEQARAGISEIVERLKARKIRAINAIPYYQAAKHGLTRWNSFECGGTALFGHPAATINQLGVNFAAYIISRGPIRGIMGPWISTSARSSILKPWTTTASSCLFN
jgi:hypothetical protein